MRQLLKISGLAYLMIFISGFYANFTILETLIDLNSSSNTTANFINYHSQLLFGIIGFFVMLSFDLFLVWTFFKLTKPVNKKLTILASVFRLFHALLFGFALIKLLTIFLVTSNGINTDLVQKTVIKLLFQFDSIWTIGLLFFAVHLFVMGYLIIKSTFIPKALGVLLILAGVGYIIDGMAKLFMSNYNDYKDVFEVIVIMPSVIGEFSFTVWLLIKGFKKQRVQENVKLV